MEMDLCSLSGHHFTSYLSWQLSRRIVFAHWQILWWAHFNTDSMRWLSKSEILFLNVCPPFSLSCSYYHCLFPVFSYLILTKSLAFIIDSIVKSWLCLRLVRGYANFWGNTGNFFHLTFSLPSYLCDLSPQRYCPSLSTTYIWRVWSPPP